MVRKQLTSGALVLCLLLIAPFLPGLEKTIELGKGSLWTGMMSMEGVQTAPGRWGFQDLVLSGGAYTADSATELLLHFDAATEDTGAYKLDASPLISGAVSAMGSGSAAFTGAKKGISLQATGSDALFSTGATWGDFTIEFWLYPATLSDGESIVSWTGSARDPSGLVGQTLRGFLQGRKLVWDFQNLFTLPARTGATTPERIPVQLVGTRQLLPRVWHHHLLRFTAREGLLEYILDGIPEAIVHVTDTGSETGSIAVPMVGAAYAGPLVIGSGFTGFLDELRVSRRAVGDPTQSRYLGTTGAAISRIIDLGFSSTRIARIETVQSTPADASAEFYYQIADTWNGKRLLGADTDWVPFTPGTDFKDTVKGRYIQIRVELFPDGTRTSSPRVSSVSIVYEPNSPPAAPAGLVATAGNGKVTLAWRKVNDLDVKGYVVFYGTSPHNYLGTGAQQGSSPVDAGSATTLEIDGLVNGSLYYFAVVSYDTSSPRQQSEFSVEVSARPSRIYK
jgi:hypothetical protein